MPYGHLIAATVMTWVYVKVIHRLQAFFYINKRVAQSLCHSSASCFIRQKDKMEFRTPIMSISQIVNRKSKNVICLSSMLQKQI